MAFSMEQVIAEKFIIMSQALNGQRPDRMPAGEMGFVEYRPDVYHLGEPEFIVQPWQVGVSKDGKKKYTHDGGVWAVGDKEKYKDHNDVLSVDINTFAVEEVVPLMLNEMVRLFANRARSCFPVPMHYGTLITRATIEFGWEPFMMAAILEPAAFGKILDRFGQASLAVAQGWAQTEGTTLIAIHDDIACTRGALMNPEWSRKYVFPWYRRIFDAIHERGRKSLYICDGNYMPILDDILATNPDGLYIESTSMSPAEFMRIVGRDRLFLIKSDSRNIDFGKPEDIYRELKTLRELHQDFPGMMIYRGGGNPAPGNAEAFNRYFQELLVYSDEFFS